MSVSKDSSPVSMGGLEMMTTPTRDITPVKIGTIPNFSPSKK